MGVRTIDIGGVSTITGGQNNRGVRTIAKVFVRGYVDRTTMMSHDNLQVGHA
jgi:hypothetical protein